MSDNTTIRPRRSLAADLTDAQTYSENRELVLANPDNGNRGVLKKSLLLLGSLSIGLALWMGYQPEQAIHPLDYKSRTDRVLKTTPLIDGHNDLPYLLRIELKNKIYDDRFTFRDGLASHTDLQKIKEGKLGGQFWSVFVECPDIKHLDDPNHNVRDTLEQIDVAKRFIAEVPELHYCETSSCARAAFEAGSIPSMLGAEGLHQAGSAVGVIRQFHALGVRYITITHNCDNPFATAASTVTETGKDGGLSEFGRAGIAEMNRLGVMVDLSHVSHRTMRDILDITKSPVMFSHSGCYGLGKVYRNAPDDVIARLKDNGGVLMVYFVPRFLNPADPEGVNIETVVDHIYHIVNLAGWDHVGIGGDFDGTPNIPPDIRDVSGYPKLIEAVMARGATDAQIRKLVGENILRVWAENEAVALKLQAGPMKPVEEVWEGRGWYRWAQQLPVMIPGNPDRITSEQESL